MTTCADSTGLRAHLDHPDAALDEHLDGCEACTGLLHAVAEDAGYVHRTLALLDPADEVDGPDATVDVEAALARLQATAPAASAVSVPVVPLVAARRRARLRRVLAPAAAAVLAVAVLVTPAGRGAVADVLDAFRGERLQVLTVDPDSWAATLSMDDARTLAAIGDVDTSQLTEPEPVADRATAEARAGIVAPVLAEGPDRYLALEPGTVRLVLRARAGNGVPAELDGAALVVQVPGAVGAVYGPAGSVPEYVVGRSGAPVIRAEGASLDELRTFLLGRDELPADLRAQLAAIEDWRSTIPVPVPVDGPGWREVEVSGRPAIAFGDDSGLGALVLRQDAEGVTVVGGRIGVGRALELAGRA